MIANLIRKARDIIFDNKNSNYISATNVQDAIDEVEGRFYTGSYYNTEQSFELPVRHTSLVVLSTGGNADLFIVTNYDASNRNVMRLSNNMSTFTVSISGNTVKVNNGGYWYKYFRVII